MPDSVDSLNVWSILLFFSPGILRFAAASTSIFSALVFASGAWGESASIETEPDKVLATLPATLPLTAAQSSPKALDNATLDGIDRQLMLRLIDLARFNIHFHETANHHQPWRDWTYPIAREAGTSMSLSNSIIDMRSRALGLDHTKRISRSGIINGDICGTMGGAIGGTASTLELVQNAMVHLHARALGYSSHTSVVHVLKEVSEIDQLRQRRAELVEQLTKPTERRVRALEAVLFHEIEEQLLFEFRNGTVIRAN